MNWMRSGIALVWLLALPVQANDIEVSIQGGVQQPGVYQLPAKSRLFDLWQLGQGISGYGLGAAWLRAEEKPVQLRLKSAVLADLQQVELSCAREQAALLAHLTSLPVTGRRSANLDPDWLEINLKYNYPLRQGDLLRVPARPDNVFVLGAVVASRFETFNPVTTPRQYAQQVGKAGCADPDWIWVIEPDGHYQKVGVAPWNRQELALAPGAMLYVPFAESWFSDASTGLNERIVQFLATQLLPLE